MAQNNPLLAENGIEVSIQVDRYKVTFKLDVGFLSDVSHAHPFPYHSHAQYELHMMLSGDSKVHFGDESAIMTAGWCCLIPPSMFHTHTNGEGDVHKRCLYLTFSGGDLPVELGQYYLWKDDGCLEEQARRISDEINRDDPYKEEMLRAMLKQFFIVMLREMSEEKTQNFEKLQQTIVRRISKIERFFHYNYSKKVTIDDLAGELFVSRRQVSRDVRRYFGMSFRDKLITTRMEIAKGFLEQGDQSIEDIACSVGYEAHASFSTAFKLYTGMSPSQYRNRYQRKTTNDKG